MASVAFLPHISGFLVQFRAKGGHGDASSSHRRERAVLNVACGFAQIRQRLPESSDRLWVAAKAFSSKADTASR
jgi:hypothetical protein